ncbi:MAG: nucleoside transporter C-terminal domain-containing protein [Elusimicrobiota bacterium]
MFSRVISIFGLAIFILLAWMMSEDRKHFNWRTILWGLGLQLSFAILVLLTPAGRALFNFVRLVFDKVVSFSDKGAMFVFGNLVNDFNIGAIFAFKILPVVIFVSSLSAILYHLGVIQFVVKYMALLMMYTMKISGAEALATALQVFLGIESNTAIKSYMTGMTRSELFLIMTAFMSTIASSVMATYAMFGAEPGHLLAASIMNAPAAVIIAKLMVPETGTPETMGFINFKEDKPDSNVIEAAANGASQGLNLALNIAAMIIAFIALIWMFDWLLGKLGVSLEKVFSIIFWPFAFLMGVPAGEASTVAKLLGTKTVFNEFIAYMQLQELIKSGVLSPKSVVIATYALCGFSNFGSIAIMLGGMTALAPTRRSEIAGLGFKSLIAGTLATFITTCIAGMLV